MAVDSPPTNEVGYSSMLSPNLAGNVASWGQLGILDTDEEAPYLRWPDSIRFYTRMSRDGQIAALWRGATLPIRRWRWGINAAGASDEATAWVADQMNLPVLGTDDEPRRVGFNHDDHLRHALLALRWGHMFHEIVGRIEGAGADAQWVLDRLAERMPQSIMRIKSLPNGDFGGIVQYGRKPTMPGRSPATGGPLGGIGTEIDPRFTIPYVWEREGANWAGESLLRPCVSMWILKDRDLRVNATLHERFGLPIPKGRAPAGASEGVVAEYGKLAQSVRSTTGAGVGLPGGLANQQPADLWAEGYRGNLPVILDSIRYYDEQMARSFLEMFAQLGQTSTGSRALGEAFIDFFEMSLDAIGGWYSTTTDTFLIDPMVRWRFGDNEQAPSIGYEKRTDPALNVADLVDLIASGLLVVDNELERWARDRWSLPDRDPLEPARQLALPAPTPKVPSPSTDNNPTVDASRRGRHFRQHAHAAAQTVARPTVGHRDPTPAEVRAGTNFTQIQATWQNATRALVAAWATIRVTQVDELAAATAALVASGNLAGIAGLTATVAGADLIAGHMQSVYEQAVSAAAAEAAAQGLTVPFVNTAEAAGRLTAHATGVAALLARTLADSAASQALQRYATAGALTADEVQQGISDHLNALSDSFLNDRLGGALTAAQNMGRMDVFADLPADVTTFLASELLDVNTCDNCVAIDGTEYANADEASADYSGTGYNDCEGGDRCRGTVIAVADEATAAA